jgi:hypothetical protein
MTTLVGDRHDVPENPPGRTPHDEKGGHGEAPHDRGRGGSGLGREDVVEDPGHAVIVGGTPV